MDEYRDAEDASDEYEYNELSDIEHFMWYYAEWDGTVGWQPDGVRVRRAVLGDLIMYEVPLRAEPEGFPRASWRRVWDHSHHPSRSHVCYSWFAMPLTHCSATNIRAGGRWKIVKSTFGVGEEVASGRKVYRIDVDLVCSGNMQRVSYQYPALW